MLDTKNQVRLQKGIQLYAPARVILRSSNTMSISSGTAKRLGDASTKPAVKSERKNPWKISMLAAIETLVCLPTGSRRLCEGDRQHATSRRYAGRHRRSCRRGRHGKDEIGGPGATAEDNSYDDGAWRPGKEREACQERH